MATYQIINAKFSDIDFDMVKHPVSLDILPKRNVAAIKQSVKNLILTRPGERPFQPFLGSKIYASLFELWTPDLKNVILTEARRVIETFEPRVIVNDIFVESSERDPNLVKMNIVITIIGTTQTVTLETFVQRIR